MASLTASNWERDDAVLLKNVSCFPLQLRRGQTLFRPGDKFTYLYAVHSGFFKSFLLDHEGREQVHGFSMVGDVLGLDGVSAGHHSGGAMSLGASEVLAMPFAVIESTARHNAELQRELHALFARQIVRNYSAMMILGSMSALERLATFLVKLSSRYAKAGYSRSDFNLPMTRQEIGSFLGMKIETVSRLFSALARDGLIEVNQKHLRIVDVEGLQQILALHAMAGKPLAQGRPAARRTPSPALAAA